MAQIKTSVILDQGLNAIHNASFGSYFALKYFLPIYDPRIDEVIHTATGETTDGLGTNIFPISGTTSASDFVHNTLEGQKLYDARGLAIEYGLSEANVWKLTDKTTVYTSAHLANNGYSYTSAVSNTTTTISDSSQALPARASLINGVSAIDAQILSATNITADGAGNFTGTDIGFYEELPPVVFTNANARDLLYKVDGFSKVTSGSTSATLDLGRYTIRLVTSAGDFRFNKIVLYAQAMNANGTENTSVTPVPFSVASFEGTQTKERSSNNGQGLLWEGVIQLVFARDTSITNLTNLVISNWSDSTSAFGLNTSDDVIIFESNIGQPTPIEARLTVSDGSKAQLRLQGTSGIDARTDFNATTKGITQSVNDGSGTLTLSGDLAITSLDSAYPNVGDIKEYLTNGMSVSAREVMYIDVANFGAGEININQFNTGSTFNVKSSSVFSKSVLVDTSDVTLTQTTSTHKLIVGGDESSLALFDVGSGIFTISADLNLHIDAGSDISFDKVAIFNSGLNFGNDNLSAYDQQVFTMGVVSDGTSVPCISTRIGDLVFLEVGTFSYTPSVGTWSISGLPASITPSSDRSLGGPFAWFESGASNAGTGFGIIINSVNQINFRESDNTPFTTTPSTRTFEFTTLFSYRLKV